MGGRAVELVGTPLWGDAAATLRANGYACAPVSWQNNLPFGPWQALQIFDADPNAGVAIVCTPPGHVAFGARNGATVNVNICALHLEIRDAGIITEIDRAIAPLLVWPETMEKHKSPVRIASDHSTLRPFALHGQPFTRMPTRDYALSGDAPRSYGYRPHGASFLSHGGCFVAYGHDPARQTYRWQGGEPLSVPVAALPVVDAVGARAILRAAESVLESRGQVWR